MGLGLAIRLFICSKELYPTGLIESGKLMDYEKRIKTKPQKENFFSGDDPITVLDFLQKLVREFSLQGMSEASL